MHLRSLGVRPEFGVSLDDFRTVGRVELGCEHLLTISRQHIEFSVNNARNGSTTVRALHPNPIRVFRNGEAEGVLLSKLGTTTAKLRAGDLIEIGDVRGLIKDGQVFTFLPALLRHIPTIDDDVAGPPCSGCRAAAGQTSSQHARCRSCRSSCRLS